MLAELLSSAFAGLCGVCVLLGCAAMGPPRPPRVERPERVRDLAVRQVGQVLEMSFTPPLLAEDGERLTKPLEAQIFRSMIPPDQKSQTPQAAPGPWITLSGKDLGTLTAGEKVVYKARVSEEEFKSQLGARLEIELRTLTRGFRHRPVESELSNRAELTLLDAPGPVEDLRIKPSEKGFELSWSAPTRTLGLRPLLTPPKYHVYRSTTGNPGSFRLRGESESAFYRDPEFTFDRQYFYIVRAVPSGPGQLAESADSAVVAVTAHDTFAPAPPTGLTVAYAGQVVELVWTANAEPDLAGYNVYRREKDTPAQRVNQELLLTPIYRDASVEPGHSYIYRVTAVDLAKNESAPSEEVESEAR